jgi:hypothetical protein
MRPPLSLLLYAKGVGFIKKIWAGYSLSDRDSISIYLFYKIYLLHISFNRLKHGPPGPGSLGWVGRLMLGPPIFFSESSQSGTHGTKPYQVCKGNTTNIYIHGQKFTWCWKWCVDQDAEICDRNSLIFLPPSFKTWTSGCRRVTARWLGRGQGLGLYHSGSRLIAIGLGLAVGARDDATRSGEGGATPWLHEPWGPGMNREGRPPMAQTEARDGMSEGLDWGGELWGWAMTGCLWLG